MNKAITFAVVHDGACPPNEKGDPLQLKDVLHLVLSSEVQPIKLLFYTEGVRWVTRDSPLLEELRAVEARGAELLACRSCLTSSGLIDDVAVGKVSSMDGIMEAMWDSENVVVV